MESKSNFSSLDLFASNYYNTGQEKMSLVARFARWGTFFHC